MPQNPNINFEPPPKLSELGRDLLELTPGQRVLTLALPFIFAGMYFYAAFTSHWLIAVASVVYLSFVTYGSTSHDLVHRFIKHCTHQEANRSNFFQRCTTGAAFISAIPRRILS